MIHPSYSELMQVINSDTEADEEPIVSSRYSIVLATSKRARQLISGEESLLDDDDDEFLVDKPLSTAVKELYTGKVKILPYVEEEERDEEEEELTRRFRNLSLIMENSAMKYLIKLALILNPERCNRHRKQFGHKRIYQVLFWRNLLLVIRHKRPHE